MFKLRKLRADSHFAIIDITGPWEFAKKGAIITYNNEYYEVKNVILPVFDFVKGAQPLTEDQQTERLPTLIVESFPLI